MKYLLCINAAVVLTAVLFLTLFLINSGLATGGGIVINEIAWMGTGVSVSDEWIELCNTGPEPVNLDGWTLKAADNAPTVKLSGTVAAGDFYLLERTDDNTLPETKADKIYKGFLSNDGEWLQLYDKTGALIDQVNCLGKWLAGDNTTKQTMERAASGEWQTSQNPAGTPKAPNSPGEPALRQDGPASPKTPTQGKKVVEDSPRQLLAAAGMASQPDTTTTLTDKTAAGGKTEPRQPFYVLFIASGLAIFSGAAILFLKKQLFTKGLDGKDV